MVWGERVREAVAVKSVLQGGGGASWRDDRRAAAAQRARMVVWSSAVAQPGRGRWLCWPPATNELDVSRIIHQLNHTTSHQDPRHATSHQEQRHTTKRRTTKCAWWLLIDVYIALKNTKNISYHSLQRTLHTWNFKASPNA